MREGWDVVIVGGGNAALSAAHAAREGGASVLVLERAPAEWAGGNSYFTAGAFRTTFDGPEDLLPLIEGASDEQLAKTELPPYTRADFAADMERVTGGRCEAELTRILVDDAARTMRWLHDKGIRFRLMYDRQSFEINGVRRFWGAWCSGPPAAARVSSSSTPTARSGAGSSSGTSIGWWTVKDGKGTKALEPPKSNWALRLDEPPYLAFAVTCGITFTFGGLRIDQSGRVLRESGEPIPALFAAGELVGGLFYDNYPGGSGLTSGSVFGRRAGRSAAEYARRRNSRM